LPAQFQQHRVDEQLLGLRFVQRGGGSQANKNLVQAGLEGKESRFVQRGVGLGLADAVLQEVLRKKLALHRGLGWRCGSLRRVNTG